MKGCQQPTRQFVMESWKQRNWLDKMVSDLRGSCPTTDLRWPIEFSKEHRDTAQRQEWPQTSCHKSPKLDNIETISSKSWKEKNPPHTHTHGLYMYYIYHIYTITNYNSTFRGNRFKKWRQRHLQANKSRREFFKQKENKQMEFGNHTKKQRALQRETF